jgi:hypothetical protein
LQRRVSLDVGAPVSEAAVWLALRKLERAHLLAERIGSSDAMTRRELLGQAGRFGAAAVAAPIVISALVPVSAAALSTCAASGGVRACTTAGAGGCVCLQTAASPTGPGQCAQSAPNPATVCTVGAAGDTACATLVGAGSTCTTLSGVGSFCTCSTAGGCGATTSLGTCFNTSVNHYCHLTCVATCQCP